MAPTFRVTIPQGEQLVHLHLTPSLAMFLADELAAGAAQLQAIYGPNPPLQMSAMLTREAS